MTNGEADVFGIIPATVRVLSVMAMSEMKHKTIILMIIIFLFYVFLINFRLLISQN